VNRIALFIAFVAAAAGGVLLFVYLRRFEQEASGGPKLELLVARKHVDVGGSLTDGDDTLTTRDVPQAYVEDRAIRASERQKVVGLRVANSVQAGQVLMWTDLEVATDDRRDLSSLVQPGMRAVTVQATTEGSTALVRPGDRVDLISVTAAQQNQDQRSAAVILQNLMVLAVGSDTGIEMLLARPGNDRGDHALTLSVTLEQAQLVSLAEEKGRLTVALRNPDDVRVTEGLADLSSSALTDLRIRQTMPSGALRRGAGPVLMGNTP
jgi:pilus assembly protein CpaB